MDTITLTTMCNSDTEIAKTFLGVFADDRLPKHGTHSSCFIANTQPHNQKGEHWVALSINAQGAASYFCSYGRPSTKSMGDWLTKHAKEWTRTTKRIQSHQSTTCGAYCLMFLHFICRNVILCDVLDLFTDDYNENDDIVTAFINGYYNTNTVVRDSKFFQ
jgi:hypothetical protein